MQHRTGDTIDSAVTYNYFFDGFTSRPIVFACVFVKLGNAVVKSSVSLPIAARATLGAILRLRTK